MSHDGAERRSSTNPQKAVLVDHGFESSDALGPAIPSTLQTLTTTFIQGFTKPLPTPVNAENLS
jgi:hypothetical protein